MRLAKAPAGSGASSFLYTSKLLLQVSKSKDSTHAYSHSLT